MSMENIGGIKPSVTSSTSALSVSVTSREMLINSSANLFPSKTSTAANNVSNPSNPKETAVGPLLIEGSLNKLSGEGDVDASVTNIYNEIIAEEEFTQSPETQGAVRLLKQSENWMEGSNFGFSQVMRASAGREGLGAVARNMADEGIRKNPDDPRPYFVKALSFAAEGNDAGFVQACDLALEKFNEKDYPASREFFKDLKEVGSKNVVLTLNPPLTAPQKITKNVIENGLLWLGDGSRYGMDLVMSGQAEKVAVKDPKDPKSHFVHALACAAKNDRTGFNEACRLGMEECKKYDLDGLDQFDQLKQAGMDSVKDHLEEIVGRRDTEFYAVGGEYAVNNKFAEARACYLSARADNIHDPAMRNKLTYDIAMTYVHQFGDKALNEIEKEGDKLLCGQNRDPSALDVEDLNALKKYVASEIGVSAKPQPVASKSPIQYHRPASSFTVLSTVVPSSPSTKSKSLFNIFRRLSSTAPSPVPTSPGSSSGATQESMRSIVLNDMVINVEDDGVSGLAELRKGDITGAGEKAMKSKGLLPLYVLALCKFVETGDKLAKGEGTPEDLEACRESLKKLQSEFLVMYKPRTAEEYTKWDACIKNMGSCIDPDNLKELSEVYHKK